MIDTETKVKATPNERKAHLDMSTRLYQSNYPHQITFKLNYMPHTRESYWDFHIYDSENDTIVWTGNLESLIEALIAHKTLKDVLQSSNAELKVS